MKIITIFVILTAATKRTKTVENTTLPLRERLELLKYQIAQEIGAEKLIDGQQQLDNPSFENIEYADTENQPITPISENDERKKHGRYLLRKLKTTPTTLWSPLTTVKIKKNKKKTRPATKTKQIEITADDLKSSSEEHIAKLKGINKILHSAGKNKSSKLLRIEKLAKSLHVESQKNVFYRRIFDLDTLKKHSPKEIIHCTSLITPLLTGQRPSLVAKKVLTYDDNEVIRLLHLLSEDPTDMTQEEIMSILYQISNMQIRLFQWNIASLKMLFKVLTKGDPVKSNHHTWRSLRAGLKRLLVGWKLDFTNVTNLLHEARLFRPPCIASDHSGSTLSSRVSLYTTRKVKRKCSKKEASGSCERR